MEYKLRDIVEVLDHNELIKMKRDLDRGGKHISQFISEKIAEKEKKHEPCCSVCQTDINAESVHTFTMVFGPESFKKKGTFCGMDCLQYFMMQLSEMRKNMDTDALQGNYEDCNDE